MVFILKNIKLPFWLRYYKRNSIAGLLALFSLTQVQAQWVPFLQDQEPIAYTPIDSCSIYSVFSSSFKDTTVQIILHKIINGSVSNSDKFQVPFYIEERDHLLAHTALNRNLFFFAVNEPTGLHSSNNSILRYDRKLNQLDTVNSWLQLHGSKEGFFMFGDDLHGFYFGPLNEARRCRTIYITSDAGNSWQLLDQLNSLPWDEYQISLRSEAHIGYLTGDSRMIESRGSVGFISCFEKSSPVDRPIVLKYSDFGAIWSKLILPDYIGKLYKFSALSEVHWTVLTEDLRFFHTKDAGTTWQLDTATTKFCEEIGYIVDYKWSPVSKDGIQHPFIIVSIRKPTSGHSTYISFDSCKTWIKLDEYAFLSFYFKPNSLGLGRREMIKSYPGGLYYDILTGVFNYANARALSYPKISDSIYICKGDQLDFSLELNDPSFWSLHADGHDTLQLGMPLTIMPTQTMEVYLFSPYHSDSLKIVVREPFPEQELELSYWSCADSNFRIDLSHLPSAGFSWSNGQQGALFQNHAPGPYFLRVEADYYCTGDYPFSLANYPIHALTQDTAICPDDVNGLPVNFEKELQSLGWLDAKSITSPPAFQDAKDLAYTLIDTNGCPAFIQWHIFTTCPPEFYLPNAFHPGGPIKENHYFQPQSRYVDSFYIEIYNRWGQHIYSGTHLDTGWDGTYAGKEAETGLYFFRIVYAYSKKPHHQERENLQGKVYLLR